MLKAEENASGMLTAKLSLTFLFLSALHASVSWFVETAKVSLSFFCSPYLCEKLFAGCSMSRERERGKLVCSHGSPDACPGGEEEDCIVLVISFVNGLLAAMPQRSTFDIILPACLL